MRDLKEVLEQNKEKYIEELKNLVGIDTHDLGHGIDGGLEKQGQEYMVNLFESMGADEITVDPMDEAVIQESYKSTRKETWGTTRPTVPMSMRHLKENRAEKACYLTVILTLCRRRWKTAGRTRRLSR